MSTPRAVLVAGLTLSVVAVPAALAAWGWLTDRQLRREQVDRRDPEKLKHDIETAQPTREARALKRLVRPPDGKAIWADLDRENLDLEHRIRRAVIPEQRAES